MNQPKFKFGDHVKTPDGKRFIVCDIRRDAECDYIYNGDRSSGPHYAEFDLELYQEPQKKKKYAVVDSADGMIIEFTSEEAASKYCRDHQAYKLAPEYDIEYPEAKQ